MAGVAGERAGEAGQPVASVTGLALRLVRHWWRQLAALAAACGVVAATISGALGVGAAVEQGLLRLAMSRLGRIDAAVVGEDFFRAALAGDMAAGAAPGDSATLVPAIVIEAVVETAADGRGPARSTRALVLACDDPATLGFAGPVPTLSVDTVAVNGPLASALGAEAGTPLVLRIAERSTAPADSPLGRRETRSTGRRVAVATVLSDEGLGQFALEPAQVTQPLVVAPLAMVQKLVDRGDVANVIFAVSGGARRAGAGDTAASLRARLAPALDDYGLVFQEVSSDPATLRLTSRRLILPDAVDRAAEAVLAPLGGQPSLVFLANAITTGSAPAATIPYSTVLGIADTSLPCGDLVDASGTRLASPGPDEIVIDRWVADDFAAQDRPVAVGDTLEVAYFLPETIHGRVEEARARLRVSGIAAMQAAAVDSTLVPEVEGVSDEASITDWDPPFPFDASRVRSTPPHDEDDRYWKTYGTTPKAFVSMATARRLAGSRFGMSTAWHVPRDRVADRATLGRSLAARLRPEAVGLRVVPLAAEARAAARGSTPFGPLFLALASFVVVAGLLLEWLLFRLLVVARRREIGVLAAIGWPPRRLAMLLALIGLVAAVAGSVVGACLGPLWAGVMLEALARTWTTAVAAGSQQAFGDGASASRPLLGALAASLVASVGALAWAAGRAARARPLALLRGTSESPGRNGRPRPWLPITAAAGAVVLGWLGLNAGPEQAVAMFFLSGAAALVAFVAAARSALVVQRAAPVTSLVTLAWRSLCGQRSRASSVIAIVAVAEFLVVSLSAFTLGPPPDPADRRSPTGGYALLASFGTPVSAESVAALDGVDTALIRSSGGNDASCTNLYAAMRPTVLGVGPAFVARAGFSFVAHRLLPPGTSNPWTLLDCAPDAQGPIPAILDQATAQWALKLGGLGARFTVPDDDGAAVEYEIVGLLAPGILQGFVVVAERSFERSFPRRSGYAFGLLDADSRVSVESLTRQARDVWADAGVTLEPTLDRLARLSAVQNTFLAGFQTLGLLGLLLGTAGVAAVQAQGVLERLGQFGLLQAIGFAPGRIRALVTLESMALVGAGLVAGAVAGLVALAPALLAGRAVLPVGWVATTCGLTLAAAAAAGLVASRHATQTSPREALRAP
ncbi:MAG: FtsX-like permease family protein [Planctomycetia bacterium]